MNKFTKFFTMSLLWLAFVQAPSWASYNNIKAVGERYITFLQKVGQSDTPVTQEEVSQLFAPQCKKIENGTVLFTSSHDLPEQLTNARKAVGKWTIDTLFITSSLEDTSCTIQFTWKGEKMTEHTTMVALFLDDKGKIIQIREVFNEYKKTLGSPEL